MRLISQNLPKPTAFLLFGTVLLGLLTGCNLLSDEKSSSQKSSGRREEPETREEIDTNESADIAMNSDAQSLYAQLLQEYDEDYESCGPSIQAQANSCSADGVTGGEAPRENLNVQLMLDASGSMAGSVGGEQKLKVAKETLTEFVGGLPSQSRVALRVYGHIGSNSGADKARSCAGTELLYNFQSLNKEKFASAIESFQPTGWTPIAGSLKQAASDFESYDPKTNENVVYLISDGIETCDGDPVTAARALNQSDVKTIVNVIGFDVDAKAAAQLREVANAGGGEYLQAANRNDLYRIFRQTSQEAYSKYRCISQEQYGAYRETSQAQYGRYRCLSQKAYKEYRKISTEVYRQSREDEITSETRDAILNAARQKRDGILKPAKEERDRILDESKGKRDRELDKGKEERDRKLEGAREERDRKLEDQTNDNL
ncbi:hypothetical protein C1752_01108 [Acaryochloris thomasi RCC1774]|uniref:VWFA domain-containing protein n=1 Tax=Acaryochloris thomasi RCC1774 TaxID=1764569 RepID=A0A2W1JLB8_9CYAN|nr:VWA domain-containing protein [Acaryochloris thomasi]PZD74158.1 hypothetical protein C1752_01108 [Acaryochloris thomasi RCC1774]